MQYNFEWNPNKAKSNIQKHKINFELAATVFKDPRALSIYDDDHSESEERWITLGIAQNGNLLVVIHTYKNVDHNLSNIRIISARKATRLEQKQYKE
jgi:uncharacterized protein